MTDWDFPQPIAELCADLAGRGFDIVDERSGTRGQLLVLAGLVKSGSEWIEAFVEICADDDRWSIAVRFDGMANWITVPAWEAYLDVPEPGDEDLAHRAYFVRYRLSEAAAAIRANPDAERALVRLTRGRR